MKDIEYINLLGYNRKETEAVQSALNPMIRHGKRLVVLYFDGEFKLALHNISDKDGKAVIKRITKEFRFYAEGV